MNLSEPVISRVEHVQVISDSLQAEAIQHARRNASLIY